MSEHKSEFAIERPTNANEAAPGLNAGAPRSGMSVHRSIYTDETAAAVNAPRS